MRNLCRFTLLFIICLTMITSCFVEPADSHRRLYNQSYGSDGKQKMDVFIPETPEVGLPMVIWFHGGGWTEGDKSANTDLQEFFLKEGIASANANYRLTSPNNQEIDHEEIFADVDSAISYVIQNVKDWGLEPAGYILAGHSAGGHLALHRGYLNPNHIVGAIDMSGATYLDHEPTIDTISEAPELIDLINWMAGTQYMIGDDIPKEEWHYISPIHFINPKVKTFIVHGKNDEVVPFSQAIALRDSVLALGAPLDTMFIEGGDHNLNLYNQGNKHGIYDRLSEFVKGF